MKCKFHDCDAPPTKVVRWHHEGDLFFGIEARNVDEVCCSDHAKYLVDNYEHAELLKGSISEANAHAQ